jgi:hypothetical protein
MNLITKFLLVFSAVVIPKFLVAQNCRPEILSALGLQESSPQTPGGISAPINLRLTNIEFPALNGDGTYKESYPILFTDVARTSNPLSGTFTSSHGYVFPGGEARTFTAVANPGNLQDTIVVVTYNPATFQLTSVYGCSDARIDDLTFAFFDFDGGVVDTNYAVTIISENGFNNVNYNLCLLTGEVICSLPLDPPSFQGESCGNAIVEPFEQCDISFGTDCCADCQFELSTHVCRNADCGTCDFAGDVLCTGQSGECPTQNVVVLELFNPTAGVVGSLAVGYDRATGDNNLRALTTDCYTIFDSNVYMGPLSGLPVRSSTGTPDLNKFPDEFEIFARVGTLSLVGGAFTCPETENEVALAARVQVLSTCGVTKGILYNAYTRGLPDAPARFTSKFPRGGATYSLLNVCYSS